MLGLLVPVCLALVDMHGFVQLNFQAKLLSDQPIDSWAAQTSRTLWYLWFHVSCVCQRKDLAEIGDQFRRSTPCF